jgi:hypothetical protein
MIYVKQFLISNFKHMQDRQENKISMYRKLGTFLEEKIDDFALYPAIVGIKNQLDANFEAIIDLEVVAGADNTGQTVAKQELQQKVINQILKVGSATALHYTITAPDVSIKEQVDYKKSELDGMRDSDQYAAAKRVFEIADPVKALLTPFGVQATDVDTLNTLKQQFFNVYQKPKQKIAVAAGAGEGVDRVIRDTDKILEEQLDVLMTIVRVDNPDLYAMYEFARKIDDTGSSSNTVLANYEGPIAAGDTSNLGLFPTGAKVIEFENKGTTALEIGGSTDGVNFDGNTVTLAAAGKESIQKESLNTAGTQLLVRNQSSTDGGSYKVVVKG